MKAYIIIENYSDAYDDTYQTIVKAIYKDKDLAAQRCRELNNEIRTKQKQAKKCENCLYSNWIDESAEEVLAEMDKKCFQGHHYMIDDTPKCDDFESRIWDYQEYEVIEREIEE